MKEATGELNMTVITVVAIAAVAAFFYAFIWPSIKKSILSQSVCSYGQNYSEGTQGQAGYVNCGGVDSNTGTYSCAYTMENNGQLSETTITCKTK